MLIRNFWKEPLTSTKILFWAWLESFFAPLRDSNSGTMHYLFWYFFPLSTLAGTTKSSHCGITPPPPVLTFCWWFLTFFSNAGTSEEEEQFFLELTGNKRIIPITKEGESDEAHDEILSLNLYRYLDTILIECLRNVFVLKKFYEKDWFHAKFQKKKFLGIDYL